MSLILGINAYHADSSAAIVHKGKLLVAVEEERFRRVKHWAGFPLESIRYCLKEVGASLSDVDCVATNKNPQVNRLRRLCYLLKYRPDWKLISDRLKARTQSISIMETLDSAFEREPLRALFHAVEHHRAHLASAFLVSPFEEALCVSVDGFGDFSSTAWGVGRKNKIKIEGRVYFPHSLGVFYSAMTQYLGFPHYGDEYKVMGLAPYGRPIYLDKMREILKLQTDGTFSLNLSYFRHHKENVDYRWDDGEPEVGTLFSPLLENLLGASRKKGEELTQYHKDMARSIQAAYEEAFFNLLNFIQSKHCVENLAIAGGCGMNSVANGRIYDRTKIKNVYVQSAAGDAGGAIGAALTAYYDLDGGAARHVMSHAALGPAFSSQEISELLEENKQAIEQAGCDVKLIENEEALLDDVSEEIIKGKVIGWFQGRMEWGPRALGNRSILGDPRRKDMKDILNLKIKRRESFRPFAPSILREKVSEWFEKDADVPFMMQVFQVKEEKRDQIPATTHADGSGRLQTVTSKENGIYYRLIGVFFKKTNVPMLLNTSFNENEPVVCKPSEALDCFLRTQMDVLVLGKYVVKRKS